jgi:hypothetical protein
VRPPARQGNVPSPASRTPTRSRRRARRWEIPPEPGADASEGLEAAQRIEKIAQRAIPVLTGVLLIISAQQGEQQRPVAG